MDIKLVLEEVIRDGDQEREEKVVTKPDLEEAIPENFPGRVEKEDIRQGPEGTILDACRELNPAAATRPFSTF